MRRSLLHRRVRAWLVHWRRQLTYKSTRVRETQQPPAVRPTRPGWGTILRRVDDRMGEGREMTARTHPPTEAELDVIEAAVEFTEYQRAAEFGPVTIKGLERHRDALVEATGRLHNENDGRWER